MIQPNSNHGGPGHWLAGMISIALLVGPSAMIAHAAKPTVLPTPDGGIQPQAVMDAKGVLHLVYFKGDAAGGDVFYVRREADKDRFSTPIRVNSQAGSGVATGTIRGAQIALGKNGRVHVVWYGSSKATEKSYNGTAPMLYSRLDDAGKAFEPERNLMTQTFNLDGGGTVAADQNGNVYVAWHAIKVGGMGGEGNRQVWIAHSTDEGKIFTKESLASTQPTGACGCCSMKAIVDSKGAVQMLYRSATANVNRDIYLLTSNDDGKTFKGKWVQKWRINSCTMSSEALNESLLGLLAAFESENQVFFTKITPGTSEFARPTPAPGTAKDRKHPSVAANDKGETILVWTEGTGWQRGGSLAWCIFDKSGKPTRDAGRVDGGIPVWGLPTVIAAPNGDFLIIH